VSAKPPRTTTALSRRELAGQLSTNWRSEFGQEEPVSVIRANYLTDFYYGDAVVLLTMDSVGVDEVMAALRWVSPQAWWGFGTWV